MIPIISLKKSSEDENRNTWVLFIFKTIVAFLQTEYFSFDYCRGLDLRPIQNCFSRKEIS